MPPLLKKLGRWHFSVHVDVIAGNVVSLDVAVVVVVIAVAVVVNVEAGN